MNDMMKELKEELINKNITLLDLDNIIQETTGSTTSLFDYTDDCIQQKSVAYYIAKMLT